MDMLRYGIAYVICWFCSPIFLLLVATPTTDTSDFPAGQACFWCVFPLVWTFAAIIPISMFGEWLSEKHKYHPILIFALLATLFFILLFTVVLVITFVFGTLDETNVRLAIAYGFTNLIWGCTFWVLVRAQRYIFQRMEWVR